METNERPTQPTPPPGTKLLGYGTVMPGTAILMDNGKPKIFDNPIQSWGKAWLLAIDNPYGVLDLKSLVPADYEWHGFRGLESGDEIYLSLGTREPRQVSFTDLIGFFGDDQRRIILKRKEPKKQSFLVADIPISESEAGHFYAGGSYCLSRANAHIETRPVK